MKTETKVLVKVEGAPGAIKNLKRDRQSLLMGDSLAMRMTDENRNGNVSRAEAGTALALKEEKLFSTAGRKSGTPGFLQEKIRESNRRIERYTQLRDWHMKIFLTKHGALICSFWEEQKQATETTQWQKIKALAGTGSLFIKGELETMPRYDMSGSQPDFIDGTMRDYQIDGLQWLLDLDASHAAGFFPTPTYCTFILGASRSNFVGFRRILGDDMGLGKTLQTCAFLGVIGQKSRNRGPHLVLCPLSVLDTWRQELARWAPHLRVKIFYAKETERNRLKTELVPEEFDVCVSTYEIALAEQRYLTHAWRWDWVVLDEGSKIKGADTQVSRVVRGLRSYGRLILTGTPIQNNMEELWPLMHFLFPLAFPEEKTRQRFAEAYRWEESVEDGKLVNACSQNTAVVMAAQSFLKQVMLRRTKQTVDLRIPEKIEKRIFLPLTPFQSNLYRQMLNKDAGLLSVVGKGFGGQAAEFTKLHNLCIQLRKVTGHPFSLKGVEPADCDLDMLIEASSKLVFLEKLLPEILRRKEKVVIFSCFTMMLDCVEDYLTGRGFLFYRLDGSTPSAMRTFAMKNFSKPDSISRAIFLVSTRAGGMGLNLQAANHVVFLDSDWNPAIDLQAQMRVHRIGQTRPVNMYRLVCKSTVEERILAVMKEKQKLSDLVMDETLDTVQETEQAGEISSGELAKAVLFGAKKQLGMEIRQVKADFEQFKAATLEEIVSAKDSDVVENDAEEELNIDFRFFEGKASKRCAFQDVAAEWAEELKNETRQSRAKKSTTELMNLGDGLGMMAVSRFSIEQEKHNAALENLAAERRKEKERNKLAAVQHRDYCALCFESGPRNEAVDFREFESRFSSMLKGVSAPKRLKKSHTRELQKCQNCPVAFHLTCLMRHGLPGGARCFSHNCATCHRGASAVAGMMFRCVVCHHSYCQDHLDYERTYPADEKEVLVPLIQDLYLRKARIAQNVQFIHCGCEHCEVCGSGDSLRSNLLVFCDGCNKAFHQRCASIPSQQLNVDWFCSSCRPREPSPAPSPSGPNGPGFPCTSTTPSISSSEPTLPTSSSTLQVSPSSSADVIHIIDM